MRKAMLFSNSGPWDSDSIGFIKIVEVEDAQPTLLSIAKDLCDQDWERKSVDEESTLLVTKEEIDSTIDGWEMSAFCDQAFDVALVTDDDVGIFLALIYL